MSTPLISIITPVCNGEDTIVRAIQSVFAQDVTDWEMIIISDDQKNYQQILEEKNIIDQRLKFATTGKIRSGSSNARNKALEIAKGKYIAVLDADDAFKPQKLSTMIPLVEKYGAAISNIEYRDSYSHNLLYDPLLLENKAKDTIKNIPWISYHAETLLPKDIPWVIYGVYICDRQKIANLLYDNAFPRMQDYVFLMSFFNEIEKIGFETKPLHIYYKREGSACNSADSYELLIQSKKEVLQKLNTENITIKNEVAKNEAKKFVEFSLKLENIYHQESQKNPDITFFDILQNNIHQLL